jgi:hypothetical protein
VVLLGNTGCFDRIWQGRGKEGKRGVGAGEKGICGSGGCVFAGAGLEEELLEQGPVEVVVGDGLGGIERGTHGFGRFLPSCESDPRHLPLYSHPRFQALLERYADDEEH